MRTGLASMAIVAAVAVGDVLAETQQILGERLS